VRARRITVLGVSVDVRFIAEEVEIGGVRKPVIVAQFWRRKL
jgi:hypothetical protein